MGGSGVDEIIAEMLQAAERIAAALVYKAAPYISETHHEFPHGILNTFERVQHEDERLAPEIYGVGPDARAERNTTAEHPESGVDARGPVHEPDPTAEEGSPDSSIEEQIHRNDRHRFEITPEEARELYEQVRDREPDFAGTGNRVNLVDTSAGPAVVRFKKEEPAVTFLKKWMPENTAIRYARDCGDVRTPDILYAGVDPTTGGEFTIMRYVTGTRPSNDPELNWLPDLLDQVQSMSSHPVPAGMELDIPGWQQQMIQHADDAYHNLPPDRLSALDELGIGPLSEYVQPDYRRAGEPIVFAHNDLYPSNLRLDDQGKLWIFDWETAGPSDPLYNASFFLNRMGLGVDEATRARATAMWTERVSPVNPAAHTESALRMYRTMEDWRGIAMCAGKMSRSDAADPNLLENEVDWYHERFSRQPDWPDISRDKLRTLLRKWAELS
ncbi:aminoglycoside phosphotransferase family protein [Nocardia sp. NPDC049220]|uniref:aminoglycoside phosphotransferase family protein n=1 Tax=Nocardia sp. NPDC049220 TaxID=3155273 RepID=UPI0033CF9A23